MEVLLTQVYGDATPWRWAPTVSWSLGGTDPLDRVSAYEADDHWHYVGTGTTELTFRLSRDGSDQPPQWPADLLQDLARDVATSGIAFQPGQHVSLGEPVIPGSAITAVAFTPDPDLGFLQVVGLTEDEHDVVRRWNAAAFLATIEPLAPRWVTDMRRASLLAEVADEVAQGVARDGSSTLVLDVPGLGAESVPEGFRLTLPLQALPAAQDALRGRLLHDRALRLEDGTTAVTLIRADRLEVLDEESDVTLQLPQSAIDGLLAKHGPGELEPVPGLRVVVPAPAG